jgi:hypothetical protein
MTIAPAASQHQVDVVIDMLAMSIETTVPLLDALAGTISRYMLVSSLDVYSNYGGLHRIETPQPIMQPLGEDSPLREQLYPYRVMPRRAKVFGFNITKKFSRESFWGLPEGVRVSTLRGRMEYDFRGRPEPSRQTKAVALRCQHAYFLRWADLYCCSRHFWKHRKIRL